MHLIAEFVDAVKTAVSRRIGARHMIAVVGELFARRQLRRFAHDPIAFDHQARAVGVLDDPFPTQQGDGAIGAVPDGDEINKGMRLVRRETGAAMMIAEFVE